MSFRRKFMGALVCSTLLMAGCGGSGDGNDVNVGGPGGGNLGGGGSTGGGNTGGGSTGGDSGGSGGGDTGGQTDPNSPFDLSSSFSYLNLQVLEGFDEFSGEGAGGKFRSSYELPVRGVDPFISHYVMSPVDSTTLLPATNATAEDYVATVNGIEISPSESYPMLQKIIGAPQYLRTALVFDVSDSMRASGVDESAMESLVNEAKAYVAAARASENESIANQEFVVWAFGRDVEDVSNGFQGPADDALTNAALDQVLAHYRQRDLGSETNLHRAIVQVTGRYSDLDKGYIFGSDGDNDLIDVATIDATFLSQMVVFSNGRDSFSEMNEQLMINAVQSQAFQFASVDAGNESNTVTLYKPVFYYVTSGVERASASQALSSNSEVVSFLTLANGEYSFATNLVQNQVAAIAKRIDLNQQYVYRFAFLPRVGGPHTEVFSTNTSGFSYSLTTTYSEETMADTLAGAVGSAAEVLDSLVEITGPNGEYLARDIDPFPINFIDPRINYTITNVASLADVSTFAPATRWVPGPYVNSDYSWQVLAGACVCATNPDGTFTITSKSTPTVTLQLTNNTLGASSSPFNTKNVQEIVISD